MQRKFFPSLKVYLFSFILLASIAAGAITGYLWGPGALALKPLGDVFLNLLFIVVIPLVFFSTSAAVAGMGSLQRVWRLLSVTLGIFVSTGLIAALFMLAIVLLFPPAPIMLLQQLPAVTPTTLLANQLVSIFTVSDFPQLFSRQHILALIVFALLMGLSTAAMGEKGKPITHFLQLSNEVCLKAVSWVMYYAPVGFFAYFAVLIVQLGPQIMSGYARVTVLYYLASLVYFVLFFSLYAYLAGRKTALKSFWRHVFLPLATSIATCSSAASIPVNLQATLRMRVPKDISETVVPLGAMLHKDGSVLGGVLKIAFLFSVYHLSFSGLGILISVVLVALLVGIVMGAIPGGGMVAEMLILSLYGLPPEALMVVAAITLLIDLPATALNVNGDSVAAMLVARVW